MKKALLILMSFSTATAPARAQVNAPDPLQFSARIQSERLAEEAIDLLHCLSDGLNLPWELGEGSKAEFRLTLKEEAGALTGSFHTPEGEQIFSLASGEARSVCEKLLPKEEEVGNSPLQSTWSPDSEPPSRQWLWAGVVLAAAVGGFFIWKSGQPAHRAFRME